MSRYLSYRNDGYDDYGGTYKLRTGDYVVGTKKDILSLSDGSRIQQELSYKYNIVRPDSHNYIKRTIRYLDHRGDSPSVQLVLGYHDKNQLQKEYNYLSKYFNNIHKLTTLLKEHQHLYESSEPFDESKVISDYADSVRSKSTKHR